MIVSYNWLQEYFDDKLPTAEELAQILTMKAFEVESVEKKDNDYILNIDVLPNRAHDCLSHKGIAKEISTLLGINLKKNENKTENGEGRQLSIKVYEEKLCKRYIGREIAGLRVGPSSKDIKMKLESIGQKSINNIVDITNYVMHETGQPMHAFDADKMSQPGISVRCGKSEEKITTLDGKEVEIDETMLIIAEGVGESGKPLALAGIKGGSRAEVTKDTKRIILESANFDPVTTRKTARKVGIQTDSSKRFENGVTPELALDAMNLATKLIMSSASGNEMEVGKINDVYPREANHHKVGLSIEKLNILLGTNITSTEVKNILNLLDFKYEEVIPIETVLKLAPTFVGVPYKYGASVSYDAPRAFDCSSFVSYIFIQGGVQIPRMAIDQYIYGEDIKKENLSPGDVVFSNTGILNRVTRDVSVEYMPGIKVVGGVDHCGLYLGENKIIHFTEKIGAGTIEKLEESKQFENIVGFRRMVSRDATKIVITIPPERMDLRIEEDIIEEIGRVFGYKNITQTPLSDEEFVPKVHKEFYYAQKIRNILKDEGFSEVSTYSFLDTGLVEVENPVSLDKGFLRSSLLELNKKQLIMNIRNADLLGLSIIKTFEIGTVFKKDVECKHGIISIGKTQKNQNIKNILINTLKRLSSDGININDEDKIIEGSGAVHIEFSLSNLINELPDVESYDDVLADSSRNVPYKSISSYPFVVRDIAVFVPKEITKENITKIITDNSGDLLVTGPTLFDKFEKKNKETGDIEKVSYAFRIVFQSYEKTLKDTEVNNIVEKITKVLSANSGWEVR